MGEAEGARRAWARREGRVLTLGGGDGEGGAVWHHYM